MLNVSLGGQLNRRCDGASRRTFLQVGSLGALGLALPQFLNGKSQAANRSSSKCQADSVILVFLGGGLSHHDSFDPKPDAPPEIRGKYRPIKSNVEGVQLSELLPEMAKRMDKVALVRSGTHENDHHETASNWVLSGRLGSAFGDYPAIGAVATHQRGFTSQLPPYVAIPRNPSFTWELGKSAFLGGRFESFKTGDPNVSEFKVADLAPAEILSASSSTRRKNLLDVVDGLARQVHGSDQLQTYDEFHRRAADLILSGSARNAFQIEKEPTSLRDRYGRTTFGQSCLLARRLVERGVGFVTINFAGWDHHSKIWNNLDQKLPEFDKAFSTLLSDMDARGMLKRTLVLAFGEFGRSPKINKDVGRDHWGRAASLLFAGAGIRTGQVIGQTDKQGAFVTRRPVSPGDVAATIYALLGLDPHQWLMHPEGRPVEILDTGEPVKELFI